MNKSIPEDIVLVTGAAAGIGQATARLLARPTTGQLIHKGKPVAAPFQEDLASQERLWRISLRLAGLPAETA